MHDNLEPNKVLTFGQFHFGMWQEVEKRRGELLPHWSRKNAIYHVVFRLADSVPASSRATLIDERARALKTLRNDPESLQRLEHLMSNRLEELLDNGLGECLLRIPNNCEIVAGALRHFDNERYTLHAYSIMPNHVHAVVEPYSGFALHKITHSWKSFTAHEINRAHSRNGDVWQHESYDHIIRSEEAFYRIVKYVLDNPHRAGIKDWPWVFRRIESDTKGSLDT